MHTKKPLYYINIEKNARNKFYWFFVNKKHISIIFSSHDTFFVNMNKVYLYINKKKGQGNLISVK